MKIIIKDRRDFPVGAIRRVRHVQTQLVRREKKGGVAEFMVIQDFALYPAHSGRPVPVRRIVDLRDEYDRRLLVEEGGRVDHGLEGGIIDDVFEAFTATNLYAIHCNPVMGSAVMLLTADCFARAAKDGYC